MISRLSSLSFPYLADKDPAIESVLQATWDRRLQGSPVLVVLIGSDRAAMEALSEHGRPLYDRPRELVVEPLSAADVGALLDLPAAEALDAYTAIGGFPVLALEWGAGPGDRADRHRPPRTHAARRSPGGSPPRRRRSIKWRERAPFTAADTAALAAQRDAIPGADHRTPLIGVSRSGFDADVGLDLQLGPEDLVS